MVIVRLLVQGMGIEVKNAFKQERQEQKVFLPKVTIG